MPVLFVHRTFFRGLWRLN